jgi:hypothetical protein
MLLYLLKIQSSVETHLNFPFSISKLTVKQYNVLTSLSWSNRDKSVTECRRANPVPVGVVARFLSPGEKLPQPEAENSQSNTDTT